QDRSARAASACYLRIYGTTGTCMIPPKFNPEAFEEARGMSAEYLGRLARASREQRQGLFVEWAERAYNLEGERSIPLVKSAAENLVRIRLLRSDERS